MQPRLRRETLRPVLPRFTYSMLTPWFGRVPPPPYGYFGCKVFVFNGLQGGDVCKVFNTNGLCAKYLLSISYLVVLHCLFFLLCIQYSGWDVTRCRADVIGL